MAETEHPGKQNSTTHAIANRHKHSVNRLLILSADAREYLALIDAAGLEDLEITAAKNVVSASQQLARCNIILGNPRLISQVLDSATQLEWVQCAWAGVDQLCADGLRKDYVLTNIRGVFGPQISEYVTTYVFAYERRMFNMRDNQVKRCWQPIPYRASREIRLGIIGLGSIGRHLASVARCFGIQVTGLNRSGQSCENVEKVYTVSDVADFLEHLDYVVLILPDTPQTKHFINAEKLRMMKPSAVLINVGRGSTVNESDLVDALQQGIIGGAVLDVFENEPLAVDSPLWNLPNVCITPHQSAISFPGDIVEVFIQNYRRFLGREKLLHVVDFAKGY